MKTRILQLTLLAFMLPLISMAQVIPNMDFEDWDNSLGYDDPDGWATPNTFGAILGLFNVFEETSDVQNGNSAARMETVFVELLGITAPGPMTNGKIVFDLSNPDEGGYKGGSPIDYRPEFLTGYYKYEPANDDTASILITLNRGDLASGTQALVGEAELIVTGTDTEYTMFTLPINYTGTGTPDTVVIFMTPSRNENNAQAGTVFRVDNLNIEGSVGIFDKPEENIAIDLFPNPAINFINVTNPVSRVLTMEVYNIIGKKSAEFRLAPGTNRLDVGNIYNGLYLYRISDAGKPLSNGKFKISR